MKSSMSLPLLLAVALAGCQETPTPEMDGSTEEDAGTDSSVVADASDAQTDPDASDPDASDGAVVLGPTCTQSIPAGAANVELCALSGPVRHVRLENVSAPPFHASAQVFIGLSAPTGSQTPLTAGQFKLQLYGGMGTNPAAAITPYFGAEGEEVEGDHTFIRSATSVCFDIHDGSETTRAAFVLWRDDTNGADCNDRTTLTLANAYAVVHAPTNGAIIKNASQYYYQAGSVTTSPTVTLFDSLAVPNVPQPPPPSCATNIATTASTRVTELCEIDGTVQHVRITGLVAAATHSSAQVLVGWDTPPAADSAPTSALAADQWKIQLYGGGPTGPMSSQPASIDAYFGEHDENIPGDASYLHAASTLCFDIHDGSATTPPYFVLWRDGVNGADCEDMATLTLATASGMELSYGRHNGALDKASPIYFYQTTHSATPTVTVFNEPALTAAEAAAGLTCATTWTANANWQPLCSPAAGQTRHFRVEDVSSQTANKYFYVLTNQVTEIPPNTTTPPAATVAGDGRFIFTGGWTNGMTSATWMRFNGGSSSQAAYQTNGVALYSAPHDVCVDLTTAPASTNLRVLMWSTGAGGANCEDFSTLTAANALYDSTTSVADTFYTAPLGTTGTNYVKISGSETTGAASLVRVVSFSEPAVR